MLLGLRKSSLKCNLIPFLPLRFLGRKIEQGEKDVLMEKRLCLEISRLKGDEREMGI